MPTGHGSGNKSTRNRAAVGFAPARRAFVRRPCLPSPGNIVGINTDRTVVHRIVNATANDEVPLATDDISAWVQDFELRVKFRLVANRPK